MRVTVDVHGSFEATANGAREVAAGTTVGALLASLGVPAEVPKIVLVNGRVRPGEYVLAPGDEISVFPPIAGG